MLPNIITDLGKFSGTFIHPVIFFLIIVSCFLITIIKIRHVIFLIIFLSIVIPKAQRFEIYTLNFYIFRVLILAGWVRIIFSKDLKLGKFENIDKAIIYWVIVSFMAFVYVRYSFDAVINQLGLAYNVFGIYFLLRILIKRNEDTNIVIHALAVVSMFVAIFMFIEQVKGINFLYIFGGVDKFTAFRMGNLRSQGPFSHPISAGVFGATMFPIYFSMWRHKWGRPYYYGIIGTLSACVIIITSYSTGPVIAGVLGIAALFFWPLRNYMRVVRYSILLAAVVLQIVITSPIWAYIKKMEVIKGSTTLHRFDLLNNLINRINEWFLFGVSSTAQWGFGMDDKANQYFFEATNGGILRLALFLIIISLCFGMIGKKIKKISDVSSQKKLWALGSALFASVVAFFGTCLWDQMFYIWWVLLALITSTCIIHDKEFAMVNESPRKLGETQRGAEQYQLNGLV